MPFIIGTAGHLDHGKTSLIKALTGQDTDRLAVPLLEYLDREGVTVRVGISRRVKKSAAPVA